MKNTLALVLMVFGLVGCAATPPPDPSKDFRAHAAAPELEQLIDEGNCWAGCKRDLVFSCDSMASVEEAKSCAIKKCVSHYQYLKKTPYWNNQEDDAACISVDTSSYSVFYDRADFFSDGLSSMVINKNRICSDGQGIDVNPNLPCQKAINAAASDLAKAYGQNRILYRGPKKKAQLRKAGAIQIAELKARQDAYAATLASKKRLEEAKKRKAEADRKKLQAQQEEFMAYIETLKNNCMTYGFTADDAIATCVQREINLERDRLQAQQIAKQNQPIIQQVQPSYRNSGPNSNALKSMGSCLQTEGSFAACSNAWQGYTPPKKTVTKCRYDAFGNSITGTCTTQ
jgi:hypothetical protein